MAKGKFPDLKLVRNIGVIAHIDAASKINHRGTETQRRQKTENRFRIIISFFFSVSLCLCG